MPSTHVTNRQGAQFAASARKFGVLRENFETFMNDEERLKALFSSMNTGNWFETLQIEANKIGARVYLVTGLVVDYTRSHNEAALAGGPQTEPSYNVLKVADKYQPSESVVTTETVILFNWPKGGGSYSKAVEWGLQNGLRKTTPHVPFAIGEQYARLNYELGPNPMYVVETTGCSFDGGASACYVWSNDAKRHSHLRWQGHFGNDYDWFAFRK